MLVSVVNVLLIAACVPMVQVVLGQNPDLFETGTSRADLKLFLLCGVLGLTGWGRPVPAAAPVRRKKPRELNDAQAAGAFGVGTTESCVAALLLDHRALDTGRHVLEFASLIVYEAVLSHAGVVVGVGVAPSMNSFGGMIDWRATGEPRPGGVMVVRVGVRLHGEPWCRPPTCSPMVCATPSTPAPGAVRSEAVAASIATVARQGELTRCSTFRMSGGQRRA